MQNFETQLFQLFLLALPIACISWTVTHEEIFHEPRTYCLRRSQEDHGLLSRKFFYLFTCEYCFSHYVTIFILIVTEFRLLYVDWRGYLIAGFSLVYIANFYMSIYARIKVDINKDRVITKKEEKLVQQIEQEEGQDRH